MNIKCKHCGASRDIHHWDGRCPMNGQDQTGKHREYWLDTHFEIEDDSVARIAALKAENSKLREFVARFLENFDDCQSCYGTGNMDGDYTLDACHSCGGTARQIKSHGVLLSELEPDARALLEVTK